MKQLKFQKGDLVLVESVMGDFWSISIYQEVVFSFNPFNPRLYVGECVQINDGVYRVYHPSLFILTIISKGEFK